MTYAFTDDVLVCAGTLAVDDAEQLLQLLAERPGAAVDLADCAHVHGACLQVLMATRARVRAWPADTSLAAWLRAALAPEQH
jgi:ABC-type transporter Mla MlaB component